MTGELEPRELRVLLCEQKKSVHQLLKTGFEKVFDQLGYRMVMEIIPEIDDAVEALQARHFDILVTDLAFGKVPSVGLGFISQVKQDFPELFVIACSTRSPSITDIKNRTNSFDVFVAKHDIATPTAESDRVVSELHAKFDRFVGAEVAFPSGFAAEDVFVKSEQLTHRELVSLMSQALSDLRHVVPEFRPTKALLKPLKRGLSGSSVFELSLHAHRGMTDYAKTVVKISPRDWAEAEVENFERYVKWMMPANKRTEVVGHGFTKRFGCIVYGFVFGGERKVQTLNDFIFAKDMAAFMRILEKVFDKDYSSYYASSVAKSAKTIAQQYRERYFRGDRITEAPKQINEVVARLFKGTKDGDHFIIGGEAFPDPSEVLFNREGKGYSEAICHGDLNGSNIMCTRDDDVAYIDFQDAGPAHVFQDFASIEGSIRMNWEIEDLEPQDIAELLEREAKLLPGSTGELPTSGYIHACRSVRKLVDIKTIEDSDWEYVYAIAAISLKLLRLPDLNDTQKARLAAATLISARWLDDYKSP